MRPSQLLPGDVLLYRNFGWLGNSISWGQWRGTSREALEYSHIGLVLDDLQSVEMNPPASRKFWLADVPWDRVDVWRIVIEGKAPFEDELMQRRFQDLALARLGERYNFGYIADLLGAGLLARLGLGGVSRWLLAKGNPMPGLHRDICSTWAEELLQATIPIDLFPDLGENQAAPADYPRSPYLIRL